MSRYSSHTKGKSKVLSTRTERECERDIPLKGYKYFNDESNECDYTYFKTKSLLQSLSLSRSLSFAVNRAKLAKSLFTKTELCAF